MKPPRPRDSRGASDSPDRGTAGASDVAWPPTPADLDGCSIVRMASDGQSDRHDVRVMVHLSDVLESAAAPTSRARHRPRRPPPMPQAGSRSRHWGVERPDVSFPFRAHGDDPRVASSATGETLRAVVALAAGVSLALLSYLQFRGARADTTALVAAVAEATASPASRPAAITVDPMTTDPIAIEIPAAVTDAVARVTSRDPVSTPVERAGSSAPGSPVRERLSKLAATVLDEIRPADARSSPAATEPSASVPVTEPAPEARPQPAALVEERLPARVAERSPGEAPPVASAAARIDPGPADEDHIHAALARWRAAYSQLDARAAREIWPSVDASALERAFQALKSQELRFDRCDLTVNGGSAQAACRGRAVYVPRVGSQSPRAAQREWTFELTKRDQRWTIASARAS